MVAGYVLTSPDGFNPASFVWWISCVEAPASIGPLQTPGFMADKIFCLLVIVSILVRRQSWLAVVRSPGISLKQKSTGPGDQRIRCLGDTSYVLEEEGHLALYICPDSELRACMCTVHKRC